MNRRYGVRNRVNVDACGASEMQWLCSGLRHRLGSAFARGGSIAVRGSRTTATTRQILDCRDGTSPAARGDAQIDVQIVQRSGTRLDGRAHLVFGYRIAYANVHENNYRK